MSYDIGLQTIKSKRIDDNLNPIWTNERLQLSWNGKDNLNLSVFDHDTILKDKSLGYCEVIVSDFLEGFATQGIQSFDCQLKNVKSGSIQFDLEFMKLV